jgi:hypothetical protein
VPSLGLDFRHVPDIGISLGSTALRPNEVWSTLFTLPDLLVK